MQLSSGLCYDSRDHEYNVIYINWLQEETSVDHLKKIYIIIEQKLSFEEQRKIQEQNTQWGPDVELYVRT